MNTMDENEIMDCLGAQTWQMVVDAFAGHTADEIRNEINEMFPTDDNDDLIAAVIDAMAREL